LVAAFFTERETMSKSMTFGSSTTVDNVAIAGEHTVTGGLILNYKETIPADSDALEVAATIDVSTIQGLQIKASHDLLLETNDATTPDDSLVLKAGDSLTWHKDSPVACPLTTDVTKFLFTEAGSVDVIFEARILVNPIVPA
jgi:hypothetical protein